MSMKCIYCGELHTKVSNSATSNNGNTCRRIVCKSCGNRFYTVERAANQTELDECRTALWERRKSDNSDCTSN